MLPVCVKCGREMRCAKNEVAVYHPFEYGVTVTDEIDFVTLGDRFKCPGCDIEIVVNFGKILIALDCGQEYLESVIRRAEETVRVLRTNADREVAK